MKRLPGDLSQQEELARMLRVDHAGEYGARRIYAGQLAVMRPGRERRLVEQMNRQEEAHFETFDALLKQRRVRPTALMPVWRVAGFALGAATALLGKKAAFACTAAVESIIDEHYTRQRTRLEPDEQALSDTIEQFRKDEVEHHDTACANGAEDAPFYPLLSASIKTASRLAIWLSERV